MNYYVLSSTVNLVASAGVSLFVLIKNPRPSANRWFALFAGSVSLWAFGYTLWQMADGYERALFWIRLAMFGSILIPVTFSEFVLRLVDRARSFISLRGVNWLILILLTFFSFSPYFIKGLTSVFSFKLWPVPGPVFYLFHIFFVGNVILPHLLIIADWKKLAFKRRRQIQYVFTATSVGFLGGMTNHFLWYGIPIPPFGNIGVSLCVVLLAYAIIKHQLMEIEVIVRKTVVFAGLFGFVVATVSSVVYLLNTMLGRFLGINETLSTVIAIVTAMLLYKPVEQLLVRLTDRFLFQKKEDFRNVLSRLSEKIITILDLDQVARMILDTLRESLRVEAGALLLKNETGYRVLNSFGVDTSVLTQTYSATDPLIEYFRSHPRMISLDSEGTPTKPPPPVLTAVNMLKARVTVPLFLQDELIGLLTLGKKKSDQEYLPEETDYFPAVAGQVAIALSNARLYGEAVEARKRIEAMQLELIHRKKMAFISDLVKGIAHEIFNPLLPVFHKIEELEKEVLVKLFNIFTQEEMHLTPEARGQYLASLQSLDKATETLKINTEHIRLVIDTLNKMQKEDKETIGAFDFKTFLKDSQALIRMELHEESDAVSVVEDVPRGLPPIRGNPTLLTQVFVNLFKNSVEAMQTPSEKKITLRAAVDLEDPQF
jgi:hypothetical protein